MDRYQTAAAYADRIEAELRNLDVWRNQPLPESAYQSQEAFLADTMTFYQWLQFILLVRIRDIVKERGHFPASSSVGVYAIRALDGVWEAGDLMQVLYEFDDFIEGRTDVPEEPGKLSPPLPVEPEPEPEPEPVEPPLDVMTRYWRTRDAALLHSSPSPGPSYDARLAERVFETASRLIEVVGDPDEQDGRITFSTVVEAERGSWVIQTILRLDRGQWRIDLGASIERTAWMFLRLKNVHPPYTEVEDARGRAMRFWEQVFNHNERWARELVTPESGDIPLLGTGEIDELCWYVGHTEQRNIAVVRVLTNTRDECRTWLTHMVRREGAWLVDLPGTQPVDGA